MRFMVLVKADRNSEAGVMPSRQLLEPMGRYNEELVSGFWIWRCASLQEAIDRVRRCPNPMPGDSEPEIRQICDAGDFGDAFTPELREQAKRLRAQLQGRHSPSCGA